MTDRKKARVVVEASEHAGYPGVLVGTIRRTTGGYEAVCERCRRRLGPEDSDRGAESALRRHRLGCRPRVRPRRGRVAPPPEGERRRVSQPAADERHGHVLASWIEREKSGGEQGRGICERCSRKLLAEAGAEAATRALRRHRHDCRPGRTTRS